VVTSAKAPYLPAHCPRRRAPHSRPTSVTYRRVVDAVWASIVWFENPNIGGVVRSNGSEIPAAGFANRVPVAVAAWLRIEVVWVRRTYDADGTEGAK
jgi:hypothetical protein